MITGADLQMVGIASCRERRKKAKLKRTHETILMLDLPAGDMRDFLLAHNLEPTYEQAMMFQTVQMAILDGDTGAIMRFREDSRTAQISTLPRRTEGTHLEAETGSAADTNRQ